MLDMLKRHEIQVLRKAGHKATEVAALAGVSRRSVGRVEAEMAVTHVDTAAELAHRRVGRPAKAEPFRTLVLELLATEPSLLTLELLRRAKLKGYRGSKSAFYDLVAAVRPTPIRPLVRFEGLPGEFSQHDFGEVDVRFVDGTRRRVHFFASRLKYSRWASDGWSRALVDHFAAIGGVPLVAVFDRPKTVALAWRRDGVVTEWNPTFAGVALDLGLGIEVCWPHRPQQKGAVENLVGWVKGSFFKQRRFIDDTDLDLQLAEWHQEVNTQRPSRATGVPPATRLAEERPRLRPLKVPPDELALRFPIVVGPTGAVTHDGRGYSMPPPAIGIAGTLYLYRQRVRIIAGRFEAVHPRLWASGEHSNLPEHRAQQVAAVSGRRAKRYLQRQHLLELGGPALDYLTELTYRRPRLWTRDVERLHQLLAEHGSEPLRHAFTQGLTAQQFGAEYVAHALHRHTPPLSPQRELTL